MMRGNLEEVVSGQRSEFYTHMHMWEVTRKVTEVTSEGS